MPTSRRHMWLRGLFFMVSLITWAASGQPASADEAVIYITDRGINQMIKAEPVWVLDNIDAKRRIPLLMGSEKKTDEYLLKRITDGRSKGRTEYEVQIVQDVAGLGEYMSTQKQDEVARFGKGVYTSISKAVTKMRDSGTKVTVHAVLSSNGGTLFAASVPYWKDLGIDTVVFDDSRSHQSPTLNAMAAVKKAYVITTDRDVTSLDPNWGQLAKILLGDPRGSKQLFEDQTINDSVTALTLKTLDPRTVVLHLEAKNWGGKTHALLTNSKEPGVEWRVREIVGPLDDNYRDVGRYQSQQLLAKLLDRPKAAASGPEESKTPTEAETEKKPTPKPEIVRKRAFQPEIAGIRMGMGEEAVLGLARTRKGDWNSSVEQGREVFKSPQADSIWGPQAFAVPLYYPGGQEIARDFVIPYAIQQGLGLKAYKGPVLAPMVELEIGGSSFFDAAFLFMNGRLVHASLRRLLDRVTSGMVEEVRKKYSSHVRAKGRSQSTVEFREPTATICFSDDRETLLIDFKAIPILPLTSFVWYDNSAMAHIENSIVSTRKEIHQRKSEEGKRLIK